MYSCFKFQFEWGLWREPVDASFNILFTIVLNKCDLCFKEFSWSWSISSERTNQFSILYHFLNASKILRSMSSKGRNSRYQNMSDKLKKNNFGEILAKFDKKWKKMKIQKSEKTIFWNIIERYNLAKFHVSSTCSCLSVNSNVFLRKSHFCENG